MSDDRNKPNIRNALDARKRYNGTNLEFSYNKEKIEQENRYKVDGQAFPETVNCFNWGACIITPVWGLFNRTPLACLSLLLGFIPYIGVILSMIFSIYCGMKGNEWAWKNNNWTNIEEFHRVQRQWAVGAISIEIILIILIAYSAYNFIQTLPLELVL